MPGSDTLTKAHIIDMAAKRKIQGSKGGAARRRFEYGCA